MSERRSFDGRGQQINQLNTTADDLELINEVRKGNRNAFSELVRRHQKALLRLCMRFVKDVNIAQDITQDSFIKAYEKISTFEGRSSFKSWLFQIGVNTAKNKLRDQFSKAVSYEDMEFSVQPKAENQLVHNAVGITLKMEIDKLPFKQKTALILRVYEDLSFAEIATIMQCPYDTAKANYRHALLKLKEVFSSHTEFKKIAFESVSALTEFQEQLMEAE
jgi:RNA polymerase sigma-70 factor, ECF subfamily